MSIKIGVAQMFSMRTKTQDAWNVLADGNMSMMLHRMRAIDSADVSWYITVPENSIDLDKLVQLCKALELNVEFVKSKFYSENAAKTRLSIADWSVKQIFGHEDFGFIISDFSKLQIPDEMSRIYQFNISFVESIDRPWIDELWPDMLAAARHPNTKSVTLLNQNQKKAFIDAGITNGAELFTVETEWFVRSLVETIRNSYYDETLAQQIKDLVLSYSELNRCVFFPFRITDSVYKFEELINNTNAVVFITNPNRADIHNDRVIDLSVEFNSYCSKTIYYSAIEAIKALSVEIACFEDPSEIMHQSIIELQFLLPKQLKFYETINNFVSETANKHLNKFCEQQFKQNYDER